MRKQNAEFKTSFVSEAGSMLQNCDYFAFIELDDYACYCIADGIDDMAGSQSAKRAVESVLVKFKQAPTMKANAMRQYLREINQEFLKASDKTKLKASITVVVTDYVSVRYCLAGNTRLRLYRGGNVAEKSADMSYSQEMVREGKLYPAALAAHEERNNLLCYVGQNKSFHPYISKKIRLRETDIIAVYTRGIWEQLDEGELGDAFSQATDDPEETVGNVEEMLLSRQAKELENYTIAVIFANKVFNDPGEKKRKQRIITATVIAIALVLLVTIVLLVLHHKRIENQKSLASHFASTVSDIQDDNYTGAQTECKAAAQLAEKLGDSQMEDEADRYLSLIGAVIAADDQFDQGKYQQALDAYFTAQNKSRYADNISKDYLGKKISVVNKYLSVIDQIALGDKLTQTGKYPQAETAYTSAQALATQLGYSKGRDDAVAALSTLYDLEKAQNTSDAAKQQANTAVETEAAALVKQGDAAFSSKDFSGARVYYSSALEKYTGIKDTAQIAVINSIIKNVDAKILEKQSDISTAEKYVKNGDAACGEALYIAAEKEYLLAKNIYANYQMDDKVADLTAKIQIADAYIKSGKSKG